MAEKKLWGKKEFWGVGFDFDQQWFLTPQQKTLQEKVIDLCRTTLRPNGIRYDKTYEYPRENLDAMAGLGLLGIQVPRELGGLGENHQCAAMVCETIARYGCPSTALVYVMHLGAVGAMLFRYHDSELIKNLLSRLDKDKLVGTLSYSDPATGGHFWYSLSSKCWKLEDDSFKVLKFSSWTTSAGFADWYVTQVSSPGFDGDYSNMTNFLFYRNEVRASTDEWSSLGMHGNQSGPIVSEALLKPDRMVGPIGDGRYSNDEIVDPFFLLYAASVWNGIAMGSIDLAKRHVCSKTHGDIGIRVCDYPTIQDYFGEQMSATNACRALVCSLALAYDRCTNDGDWSVFADVSVLKRENYLHMAWQTKFSCAKNVAAVVDVMLQACGGTGYKTELGLERLLRDAKAGSVMGPSNEVLRGWVGKRTLMGMEAVDYWSQVRDERVLRSEVRKMNAAQKRELANTLLEELAREEETTTDKFDFDNPLSAKVPTSVGKYVDTGVAHSPAFVRGKFSATKLTKKEYLTADEKYALFVCELSDSSMHIGCKNGQYIEVEVPGSTSGRYISPLSPADTYGKVEFVIRYESQGELAKYLKTLEIGSIMSFRGPCGGFEYEANKYKQLVFICGSVGISPALQITRAVLKNSADKTEIAMFYQAKNADELLFRDELDGYTRKNGNFSVAYTLQDPDDNWNGSDGYIDYVFLAKRLPSACTDGTMKVVICGGAQMITTCINALSMLRFRSEDIFVYGPFAAEQVRAVYGRKAKLFTE